MKLKCATLALAFISFAGHASAADWMKFGDSDGGTWYVGAESVKATGNVVSFWTKLILSAKGRSQLPAGQANTVIHASAACGGANITIDSNLGYKSDGSLITMADHPQVLAMPPDSVYGNIVSTICEAKHIPQ